MGDKNLRHIVLLTTSYPVDDDGSEAAGSFVVDFVMALAEKIKITVVAPGRQPSESIVSENLVVRRFQTPSLPLSSLKVYNPFHWLPIVQTLIDGKKITRQVVESGHVDHILALWVLPSGFWAKTIAQEYQIPYSTWALGSDIWSLGKIPIVKNVLKNVLLGSYLNFADGLQLKEDVTALSGRSCEFLPSTRKLNISTQKNLSEKPPYKLAFLGRWHLNKGVDLLCESLMLLKDSDWQRIEEVRICGGGPLASGVNAGVSRLKRFNRPVSLHGYLNKEEAVELLLWADYVLIPSRIESIPVIFSDAMKCGCPVVCMPVGDLPRLMEKYAVGVLASEVSGQGFATAIGHILQRSPYCSTIGLEQVSRDFNLDHIVTDLLRQLFDNGC